VAVVQEGDKWVDVRPASPAARDDLILDNGNRVVQIVKSRVRLDNERQRELAFLEQRVCRWDGVNGRSHILWEAVRIWGGSDARLFRKVSIRSNVMNLGMLNSTYIRRQDDRRRGEVQLGDIEGLVEEIGRVELVEGAGPPLGRDLLRLLLRSGPKIHG
jgi:hypothetical protein